MVSNQLICSVAQAASFEAQLGHFPIVFCSLLADSC
jgi:hypothetical protein